MNIALVAVQKWTEVRQTMNRADRRKNKRIRNSYSPVRNTFITFNEQYSHPRISFVKINRNSNSIGQAGKFNTTFTKFKKCTVCRKIFNYIAIQIRCYFKLLCINHNSLTFYRFIVKFQVLLSTRCLLHRL